MKKLLTLITLMLVMVMLAGCLPKKETSVEEGGVVPQKETGEIAPKEEGFTGKLKDAIARNIPMKCTWSMGDFSATGYMKGGKYYTEAMQGEKPGFMIMKDNCMWTWAKEEKQGVKMCFDPTEAEDMWEYEGGGSPTDVNLKCVPTVVSDSKFVPPSDVKFMDMDEMMKGMGQPGE